MLDTHTCKNPNQGLLYLTNEDVCVKRTHITVSTPNGGLNIFYSINDDVRITHTHTHTHTHILYAPPIQDYYVWLTRDVRVRHTHTHPTIHTQTHTQIHTRTHTHSYTFVITPIEDFYLCLTKQGVDVRVRHTHMYTHYTRAHTYTQTHTVTHNTYVGTQSRTMEFDLLNEDVCVSRTYRHLWDTVNLRTHYFYTIFHTHTHTHTHTQRARAQWSEKWLGMPVPIQKIVKCFFLL